MQIIRNTPIELLIKSNLADCWFNKVRTANDLGDTFIVIVNRYSQIVSKETVSTMDNKNTSFVQLWMTGNSTP